MTGSSCQSCRPSIARPSWLQATVAEAEQRMQSLALSVPEDDSSDSFAQRAENYYHKRPQLLGLLQDLYNRYLALADRYCQSLLKQHPLPHALVFSDADDDSRTASIDQDSDAESSLSYQQLLPLFPSKPSNPSADAIVAELVMGSVRNDLLLHEIEALERQAAESAKKTELQQSLLEVLESERLVLLSENARLECSVSSVAEENKGLVSEAAFMKLKAAELARCVVRMRDDHRVCLLSRRIEDLQAQIYGLEKRNKECYEQMTRREEEKREAVKQFFFEVERLKLENASLREAAAAASKAKDDRWRILKWWYHRLRKAELVLVPCGPKQDWKLG